MKIRWVPEKQSPSVCPRTLDLIEGRILRMGRRLWHSTPPDWAEFMIQISIPHGEGISVSHYSGSKPGNEEFDYRDVKVKVRKPEPGSVAPIP